MRFPEEIKKKKVHGILKIIEPWYCFVILINILKNSSDGPKNSDLRFLECFMLKGWFV